jgi:hypothetical protein
VCYGSGADYQTSITRGWKRMKTMRPAISCLGFAVAVLAMTGCANLKVQTYDALNTSERIPEVQVKIVSSNGNQELGSGLTDPKGSSGFNMKDGTYTVMCEKPGYFPEQKTINFDKTKDTAPININLTPRCTVTGNLAISDGSIPLEATVRALTRADQIKKGEARSLGDGTFSLPDLRPGDYVITAETVQEPSYYGEISISISKVMTSVNITMTRKEYEPSGSPEDPKQLGPDQIRPPVKK